jgi:hypothetical protein
MFRCDPAGAVSVASPAVVNSIYWHVIRRKSVFPVSLSSLKDGSMHKRLDRLECGFDIL